LSGLKILFVQALLFWIVHLNSTSRTFFWVLLPLLGLWLGFLVLRSKSLIPSISTHFVYNFIVYLS
jgi:membrane protease YdiL (CAAX protease family)